MEKTEQVAWQSVLVNLLLVAIKVALAALSGSLALVADAIHSLTDVAASVLIVTGVRISRRRSRNFPYGLYKVENLASLGTSLLVFYAGYEIVAEGFDAAPSAPTSNLPLSAAGVLLCILITWAFSRYELRQGRATASPSLIADARHIATDMLASLVILTSLIGAAWGFSLDRYAALVVVVFVARSALEIFTGSLRVLLDASLAPAVLDEVRETALADPRVTEVRGLRGRSAGRYRFVELELVLGVKTLAEAHQIAEQVEQRVRDKLGHVDHVQIHMEPLVRELLVLAAPVGEDQQALSEQFGEAPAFRRRTLRRADGQLVEEAVLPNPHQLLAKARGIETARWLAAQGVDGLLLRRDLRGKGPGFVLSDAGVTILQTRAREVSAALDEGTRRLLASQGAALDTAPQAPSARHAAPMAAPSEAPAKTSVR